MALPCERRAPHSDVSATVCQSLGDRDLDHDAKLTLSLRIPPGILTGRGWRMQGSRELYGVIRLCMDTADIQGGSEGRYQRPYAVRRG